MLRFEIVFNVIKQTIYNVKFKFIDIVEQK